VSSHQLVKGEMARHICHPWPQGEMARHICHPWPQGEMAQHICHPWPQHAMCMLPASSTCLSSQQARRSLPHTRQHIALTFELAKACEFTTRIATHSRKQLGCHRGRNIRIYLSKQLKLAGFVGCWKWYETTLSDHCWAQLLVLAMIHAQYCAWRIYSTYSCTLHNKCTNPTIVQDHID
jgi:hypothetical protein